MGHTPILIDPHRVPGVAVEIDRPEEVGADRVVNTAAAFTRAARRPVHCHRLRHGHDLRRGLGPGQLRRRRHRARVRTSPQRRWWRSASRLYRVEFVPPATVVGKSTIHAMQSGIMLGYISLVEGMIRRFHDELGACRVVATGGFAPLFARHTSIIDAVDSNLTLEGSPHHLRALAAGVGEAPGTPRFLISPIGSLSGTERCPSYRTP